ncbi:hypothetical protein [Pseudonocardia cypriaca]|uniref:DUF732 domain-containing protein n=1 Tax=Pseudonocardia cypriaca TaxID=882449 RepID=A0A543FVE0_9PSEU|nr:hypothetical protein [Pseudonocardia cypriaca]TQM37773.1 hypothetical protein FB388_4991 [Pseudonocardia cypriaca]
MVITRNYGLALLALVVAAVVGGCAGPAVAGQAAPAFSPTERAFLTEVADGPGIQWSSTNGEKLRMGLAICGEAPRTTRGQMIAKMMAPPKPWPLRPSEIVVDQAKAHLCPTTPWAASAVTPLPPAPPLESWVVKGSDFQQTVDLHMQTAMMERLDISVAEATVDAARSLAYYMCTGMRAGQRAGDLLVAIYPAADAPAQLGVSLAASEFCLDAVPG